MLAIGRLVGAVHRIKIILRLDHILDHLEIGTLGNQVNVVIPADGQESSVRFLLGYIATASSPTSS